MGCVAYITRHSRYHPEMVELDGKLNWSKDLWVSNVFRAFEWLFGRAYGIRAEAATSVRIEDGKLYVEKRFFTFEAVVCHVEVLVRSYIKTVFNWFYSENPFVIPRPVFLTLQIFGIVWSIKTTTYYLPFFIGAIAFDAVASDTALAATSLTFAHTCTGSNLVLGAPARVYDLLDTGDDNITGITYNSVALTRVNTEVATNIRTYMYILTAPATGANNLVLSASEASNIYGIAQSYTGCSQTGQPNAENSDASTSATNLTVSVTTTADNCWLVSGTSNNQGGTNPQPGTNTTARYQALTHAGGDSNAPMTPAGSHSQNWTTNETPSSGSICVNVMAIKPPDVDTPLGIIFI